MNSTREINQNNANVATNSNEIGAKPKQKVVKEVKPTNIPKRTKATSKLLERTSTNDQKSNSTSRTLTSWAAATPQSAVQAGIPKDMQTSSVARKTSNMTILPRLSSNAAKPPRSSSNLTAPNTARAIPKPKISERSSERSNSVLTGKNRSNDSLTRDNVVSKTTGIPRVATIAQRTRTAHALVEPSKLAQNKTPRPTFEANRSNSFNKTKSQQPTVSGKTVRKGNVSSDKDSSPRKIHFFLVTFHTWKGRIH